jgi:hypothetical protein
MCLTTTPMVGATVSVEPDFTETVLHVTLISTGGFSVFIQSRDALEANFNFDVTAIDGDIYIPFDLSSGLQIVSDSNHEIIYAFGTTSADQTASSWLIKEGATESFVFETLHQITEDGFTTANFISFKWSETDGGPLNTFNFNEPMTSDSWYLDGVPEPGTTLLIALSTILLVSSRKRS